MKTLNTARDAVKELSGLVTFGDLGPVAGDVETIVRWLSAKLNDAHATEDVARLARIVGALNG